MKTTTDKIKPFHLFVITLLFNLSSVLVFRGYTESGNRFWIAILLAGLISVLFSFVYYYLALNNEGQTLFLILRNTFNKKIGVTIGIILSLYSLFVATRVIKGASSLITTVSLDKTPEIVIMGLIALVCVYAIIKGVNVFGRFSMISFYLTLIFLLFSFILGFKSVERNVVLAKSDFSTFDFINDLTSYFCFPFGENILLYNFINKTENLKKGRKSFILALISSVTLITLISIFSLSVLGLPVLKKQFYTFYSTISVINFGELISRMEIIVSIVVVLSLFVKYCVCLFFVNDFIKDITIRTKDKYVFPLLSGLTLFAASFFDKNNIAITKIFLSYKLWAPIIQVLIPVLIIVFLKIKSIRKFKTAI